MDIKEAMLNGYGADRWHKDKIKENNKQWFILTLFLTTIYIGHTCILFNRFENLRDAERVILKKDSIIAVRNRQVDTLQQQVDSSVYFHEIINSKN